MLPKVKLKDKKLNQNKYNEDICFKPLSINLSPKNNNLELDKISEVQSRCSKRIGIQINNGVRKDTNKSTDFQSKDIKEISNVDSLINEFRKEKVVNEDKLNFQFPDHDFKTFFEKSFKRRLSYISNKKCKDVTNELKTPKMTPMRKTSDIWIPIRVKTSCNLQYANDKTPTMGNNLTHYKFPNHKRIRSSIEVDCFSSNIDGPKIKANKRINNQNLSWVKNEWNKLNFTLTKKQNEIEKWK